MTGMNAMHYYFIAYAISSSTIVTRFRNKFVTSSEHLNIQAFEQDLAERLNATITVINYREISVEEYEGNK